MECIYWVPERAECWVAVDTVIYLRVIQNKEILYCYLSGYHIV